MYKGKNNILAVHTNKPPVEAKAPNARIAYTPAKVYTVVQAGTNKGMAIAISNCIDFSLENVELIEIAIYF